MSKTKPLNAAVTGEPKPFDLNEKRFYLPGYVIAADCPKCGMRMTRNVGDNYLSYPKANKPEDVHLCCNNESGEESCDGEAWVPVIVNVSLLLADPQP